MPIIEDLCLRDSSIHNHIFFREYERTMAKSWQGYLSFLCYFRKEPIWQFPQLIRYKSMPTRGPFPSPQIYYISIWMQWIRLYRYSVFRTEQADFIGLTINVQYISHNLIMKVSTPNNNNIRPHENTTMTNPTIRQMGDFKCMCGELIDAFAHLCNNIISA